MNNLKHPHYGYTLTLSDEAAEIQRAIWRAGRDGHVDVDDCAGFSVQAPTEYVLRVLQLLLDVKHPDHLIRKLLVLTDADMHHEGPDPESNEAHPQRWAERMVGITFMDRTLLPYVTACANWMADGPGPSFRESPLADDGEVWADDHEGRDPD